MYSAAAATGFGPLGRPSYLQRSVTGLGGSAGEAAGMDYGPEEYADHVDALYDTLFRPSLNPSNSSKSKAELDLLAGGFIISQTGEIACCLG